MQVSFTAKKTKWVIMALWLFPTLFYLPVLIPTTDIVDGNCLMYVIWPSRLASQVVPLTVVLPVEYIGPTITMAICYGRMYLRLKNKVRVPIHVSKRCCATINDEQPVMSSKLRDWLNTKKNFRVSKRRFHDES
jgi:hypothetical protein